MARVDYQFDEHMSGAVARALRGFSIDVVTPREAGLLGAPDDVHLAHAHAHGRVFVAQDEDFSKLHSRGMPHSGIVYFPGGHRPIGELVESLRLVYESYTAEEMVGRLQYM